MWFCGWTVAHISKGNAVYCHLTPLNVILHPWPSQHPKHHPRAPNTGQRHLFSLNATALQFSKLKFFYNILLGHNGVQMVHGAVLTNIRHFSTSVHCQPSKFMSLDICLMFLRYSADPQVLAFSLSRLICSIYILKRRKCVTFTTACVNNSFIE